MTKTLYLAPEPKQQNFNTVRGIWNRLEKKNIPGLKIIGIQAHSQWDYSLISSPDDFQEVPDVIDIHVAPILALSLIDENWLEEYQDERGAYKQWKHHAGPLEYPTVNAKHFGFTLGGCGRMGAMMAPYPWVRVASAFDTFKALKDMRANYNINCINMASHPSRGPRPEMASEVVREIIAIDFSGTDEHKYDINLASTKMNSDLMRLGIARLRRIK
jgi:ribose 5-phosphate isomerase RpiB